jgi:outer membrane receptor protein involved in Fe transport
VPLRATIQFTYEFHLPPPAPPPQQAPPPVTPTEPTQSGSDQTTLVLAQRPISAASSMTVRERDFKLRPIGSVADILRVTPGLLVVQHAGGGKANQYFLRGFDADHGTDIAFSIDGVPINMVSHAHGQGYSDTSFIIPETVERIEITKGPYFAEQGDFATAGSVNLVTKREFQHSSIGFGTGGSPGYGRPMFRGLLIASPKMGALRPMFAAEVGRSDGPFDNPEKFDRYKLFNKVSLDVTSTSTLSLGASSYAGGWFGSGQIAQREVAAGRMSRFGTHDPTEGGDSARHQVFASYRLRPTDNTELQAMAYLASYRVNLYSNFTLYRDNPIDGDGIVQRDRRTMFGGKTSYRLVHEAAKLRFDTSFGANLRSDIIQTDLSRQTAREVTSRVRASNINESSVGAFAREEITFTKWLRAVGSGRADFFSFAVDDANEPVADPAARTTGVRSASQLSPKASVIVTPLATDDVALDVYGNYGHGFHSNDARGVVLARNAVTPLTRAIGSEAGARARLFDRWDVAVTGWQLDLKSETVWIGDEGTTEAGGATRRYGIELETRFEITKWLAADLDLTATKAAFTQNAGNGASVALAPRHTWAGGLSARHPSGFRGGLRLYGISDRPATEDYPAPGSLVADGFTVFDLHAGYQHRRFDVALDIENLFDAHYKSAQFATTSRLPNEAPTNAPPPSGACGNGSRVATSSAGNFAGCEDIHFTPGYPFTVRLMTTLFLD